MSDGCLKKKKNDDGEGNDCAVRGDVQKSAMMMVKTLGDIYEMSWIDRGEWRDYFLGAIVPLVDACVPGVVLVIVKEQALPVGIEVVVSDY